jgi:hypothetical protein
LESKKETTAIKVAYAGESPMVSITFPHREAFQIWKKDQLLDLILDLNAAYYKWELKEQRKNHAKA